MSEDFKFDDAWRERIKADEVSMHEFELMYFGASNFGRDDGRMRSCDEYDAFPEFWDWLATNIRNMARPAKEQT